MSDPERTPVIVAVGQVNDRPADPNDGLEPLALMVAALRAAEADAGPRAGAPLLGDLDSLAVRGRFLEYKYGDALDDEGKPG